MVLRNNHPISRHAVIRFMERVRPDLKRMAEARFEMEALMRDAERVGRPDWIDANDLAHAGTHRGYLLVMPGIVFCLSEKKAGRIEVATVLTAEGTLAHRRYQVAKWQMWGRR